jgi:hypothetical protein
MSGFQSLGYCNGPKNWWSSNCRGECQGRRKRGPGMWLAEVDCSSSVLGAATLDSLRTKSDGSEHSPELVGAVAGHQFPRHDALGEELVPDRADKAAIVTTNAGRC